MYHAVVITMVINAFYFLDVPLTNWILYPIVFLLTITVSYLSYNYFELPFLKKKLKYSFVKSGDFAKK
ncbi:MAG: hypothetical protein D6707_06755 [Bacteroidetes bacterium]|nr:MAG: hypothetical protein D6707_06755 [Bacteroidota bacterium]